ncbi:BREX-1 system phosphatase PglZ type A [uncultured Sphaerotilus sp.]|uniref:BREX-1 system phosphatase PglZ type A n=1 Tax=uncultured Sphaerotilus sp. TaxID=474984 RepID=UPI0030CA2157
MSSEKRVADALSAAFSACPSVFWHDTDGEFSAVLDQLALGDQVRILRIDELPALQVKLDLEADLAAQGGQHWLLYSNRPEPPLAQDWLLDVRLRSKPFHADAISIAREDLGLSTLSLMPHLKLRAKFLRSRERLERLKRHVLPDDDAEAIDRKMMAVLLRCEESDVLALALHLLMGLSVPGEARLADEVPGWQELVEQELAPAFWLLMELNLGYKEAEPSLTDLLRRVLVTDFARNLAVPCPAALAALVLPNRVLAANASVLAARWRNDLNRHRAYADLSDAVADAIDLPAHLHLLTPEHLADCTTFAAIERHIVRVLKDRVTAQGGAVLDNLRPLIARRRDGPWVNRNLAGTREDTRALAACYDALEAAAEFFALKERHEAGLSFTDAADAVARYRGELFGFDQRYRRVHRAAAQVEPMGWAVLHGLRDAVEAAYSGWFMPQLSSAWDRVIDDPATGLLQHWQLAELPPQQRFFDDRVAAALGNGGVKRVFVVISDALRYEAAEELAREINGRNRLTARLDAMLGVLPSYTSLGMAALLPHTTLDYRGANAEVYADGLPTATLEGRQAVLARYSGLAIKADELLTLGKDKGRERVKEHRVVYVYHDRIDMLGDKQVSEGQTFDAVADTLAELQAIVGFIVNNLNGSTVLITADHGFIYQESALDSADKAALGDKPEGTLKAKKRYLLGRDLPASDKAWCGNTAVTAGTVPGAGSLDFWVPRGTARFHFAGGARFVHGSAMPQEVIIPVLTVRENESASGKTRPVDLTILGASNRVVNNYQRFEFIQIEAVSARVLARTVRISLRDGMTPISDEPSLTFDSASDQMNERTRSVSLTVRSGQYDRLRDYHLVAVDVQTKVEVLRLPVRIDLAFSNDF